MDLDARQRFAFFVGAMNSAGNQFELWEARKAADAIAREHGMTFDQAQRAHRSPVAVADPGDDNDEDDEDDDPEPLHHPSTEAAPGPEASDSQPSTTGEIERVAAVKAALAADPDRSDRDVAREIVCSPTTVGRARSATGLTRLVRKVTRGSSTYGMATGPREPEGAA